MIYLQKIKKNGRKNKVSGERDEERRRRRKTDDRRRCEEGKEDQGRMTDDGVRRANDRRPMTIINNLKPKKNLSINFGTWSSDFRHLSSVTRSSVFGHPSFLIRHTVIGRPSPVSSSSVFSMINLLHNLRFIFRYIHKCISAYIIDYHFIKNMDGIAES